MHIAVLDANTDRSALAARNPTEMEKFRALLAPSAPDWTFAAFKVDDGEFPETLTGFDGIIISGSPASARDSAAWVGRLQALVRDAVARDVPVFGACFGHQIIAAALGGTIDYNPHGWELGRVESRTHSPAPWMDDDCPVVALHAAHKEQVTVPPPGARVLGGTDLVPNAHLAIGDRVFTTQYHPEITTAFMAELIEEMDGSVDPAVTDRARQGLPRDVNDAAMARWIANFFNRTKG